MAAASEPGWGSVRGTGPGGPPARRARPAPLPRGPRPGPVAEAGAPDRLRKGRRREAELAHAVEERPVEPLRLVALRRTRRQLALGKVAGPVAQERLLRRQRAGLARGDGHGSPMGRTEDVIAPSIASDGRATRGSGHGARGRGGGPPPRCVSGATVPGAGTRGSRGPASGPGDPRRQGGG